MYQQVKNRKDTISISSVLQLLGVSKSGYYAYLKRKPCKQKTKKKRNHNKDSNIHKESKEIYGAPKRN